MIEFLVAIVAFVFVLGFIVTIHEGGHFYFAKKAGILCSEFAIGMGPVIYRVKKGETYYSIRAIPIGGYVSMAGEDMNELLLKDKEHISLQLDGNKVTQIILDSKIDSSVSGNLISYDVYGKDSKELFVELEVNGVINKYYLADECYYVLSQKQQIRVAPYDRCFESKTLMQRFLTIFAGPFMNLVLALLIFLIVGMASGVSTNENVIGTVSTNTALLYLEEGDVITSIQGYDIDSWDDISYAMSELKVVGSDYLTLNIIRDGTQKEVSVKINIQINSVGITNINNAKDEVEYTGQGIMLGEVPSGNKASEVSLQKYDIITGVYFDGEYVAINNWSDAMSEFAKNTDKKTMVKFEYIRNDETNTSKEVEIFDEDTLQKLGVSNITYTIGISPTTKFSFIGGIQNGLSLTWSNATIIFSTLGMVLNPTSQISVSDLSGPVGIFALVQSYLSAGFIVFLSLIGMLSINFFVVNLLPLPALDGGRLVFLGIEAVTKKPVDKKVENTINTVGFVLLMALMLYVTFNDLLRM